MRNASERKDIRRHEKAAKLEETARINFVVAAMSTEAGRTYFRNLLGTCHIFADPFSGDALREAYSKGERNIGLYIYNDIVTHCPDYFVMMMKEANIAEILNERRNADTDGTDDADDDGDASGEFPGSTD